MRRSLIAFLILISVPCAGLGLDECSSADLRLHLHAKDPQVVKTLEDQWARAYEHRDTAVLNCILADDFEIYSMPSQDFQPHDKRAVLEWVASRTGSAELDQLQTKPYGFAVLARGVYSVRQDGKVVSRFQFTDFFVYRRNRWQAVSRVLAQLGAQ